jgi:GntR family transcriptional repressor for pyruvate dehydrogenase complex
MFVAPKKTRLCEDIVNQLKSLIENHSLRLGDKLPSETELAERFGVSRVTIREAIRIMEILGMVKTYRGKGTIVIAVNSEEAKKRFASLSLFKTKDLSDLLQVREIVEPEVAAQAAVDATNEALERMESALEEMILDIEKGGIGAEEAVRFHHEIYKSVKNEILADLMESIMLLIEQSTHVTLNLLGRPRVSYDEHMEIFKAIRNKDPKEARDKMKYHLRKVKNALGFSK